MPAIKLTKEQELIIISQYKKGKYAREIARWFNVGHQVVTNCLRRNNIKVKKVSIGAINYNNGNWNGGIRMIKGYKHVYRPKHHLARGDGWVALHRFFAEIKLKRMLREGEVVHHKDENILDNSKDNLEIHINNGEHIRNHIKNFNRDINSGKFYKK